MAELLGKQRDTAADDGSAEPLPWQSDGPDKARTKNGMHLCREYDLLASEATEGG